MKGIAAENVNTLELENFYYLLAAYRELSDSLFNFEEVMTRIDWSPWHEERFA